MKKLVGLLLFAFIFFNNSNVSAQQNNKQTTPQVQSPGDKTIAGGSKERQKFISSCMVDANAGKGLNAGMKKIFCDCLWEKTNGNEKLKEDETKGCMEKVQKMAGQ